MNKQRTLMLTFSIVVIGLMPAGFGLGALLVWYRAT